MVVYQLIATGASGIGSSGKISSKKIFKNRISAKNYIEEFKIKCTSRVDGIKDLFTLLNDEFLVFYVIELELED